ncbi:carboxy-terminal protease [Legionella beliardensis]|uniref:Carboxy-terminal protease n=1 Tax=Legionella beliardensis TaxID=91822 RepID=A0A378HZ78_9GAMM|nr:S41 family peptidase [Legionella beliardensis]STX27606.1 carboxy-terminal protease [Legionella beliardensis]
MLKRRFCSRIQQVLLIQILFSLPLFAAKNDSLQIAEEEVQRFSQALYQIKQNYVKSVKDVDLFDNAIRGMLSGLDPHSAYLDENEFNELKMSTSGNFAGIGIEITQEQGLLKVVTPLIDTPAYKAGIKAGDYIVKLGSKPTQGLSLTEAVNLMRGEAGTPVSLVILRKGVNKPLTFSMMRQNIQIKSVQSKLLDQQFGYIRLSQFQEMTGSDMRSAINKLKEQTQGKLKGLILDLRNNPGGLLDSAIEVADAFIDNKKGDKSTIVYTEGRLPESKFTALATPGDILNNAPLIVLINNGSASASEIVAGALKDHKRAVIVGTKSFGKGSVQTVLPLDEKHAIKLTTALYYTPAGTSIQATGIAPDIQVEEISIAKAAENKKILSFNEINLSKHLENEKNNSKIITPLTNDREKLLYDDFQLYSALTIIWSMSLTS